MELELNAKILKILAKGETICWNTPELGVTLKTMASLPKLLGRPDCEAGIFYAKPSINPKLVNNIGNHVSIFNGKYPPAFHPNFLTRKMLTPTMGLKVQNGKDAYQDQNLAATINTSGFLSNHFWSRKIIAHSHPSYDETKNLDFASHKKDRSELGYDIKVQGPEFGLVRRNSGTTLLFNKDGAWNKIREDNYWENKLNLDKKFSYLKTHRPVDTEHKEYINHKANIEKEIQLRNVTQRDLELLYWRLCNEEITIELCEELIEFPIYNLSCETAYNKYKSIIKPISNSHINIFDLL
ncbi:hypothetical protein IB642_02125 [Allofrancisella guangzhouensis]|uniref:Uncharacterized protein n=1 Tax=Allofrancisella guangzhouensis TaxID=594679 RepID=A0A0A8E4J0_9GAMM|nr:hypothetical protein [Allofrancisella guangzhouensis]AJC48517.1 hypothetical protein SD28_02035 [Allofrancisella guangzhouensis]MBK2027825.1 hypothetical protein [Allofrancisella guangzhouensis]MBK2043814.1 hypothetical protein [Allofrancisella guangzhouensis]MBK2045733.1 hypothetical protein [Allofrancisella guangzhouensis]